ncbi:hypothetical protein CR513_42951, partial [Mucuna pruriens]
MSPYRIVFGKACHLEIEHRAYWTMERCNLTFDQEGNERKLQSQELEELHFKAYENSKIYKEKVKRKLCSKWDGPFVITNIFPYGTIEIRNEAIKKIFEVNRHQLKPFRESPTMIKSDVEDLSLVKPTLPICGGDTPRLCKWYLDSLACASGNIASSE